MSAEAAQRAVVAMVNAIGLHDNEGLHLVMAAALDEHQVGELLINAVVVARAVAAVAEERLDRVLGDAELLTALAYAAEAGTPLSADGIGLGGRHTLAACSLAAASVA